MNISMNHPTPGPQTDCRCPPRTLHYPLTTRESMLRLIPMAHMNLRKGLEYGRAAAHKVNPTQPSSDVLRTPTPAALALVIFFCEIMSSGPPTGIGGGFSSRR